MYILIILVVTLNSYNTSIHSIPNFSYDACNEAAYKFKKKNDSDYVEITTLCVRDDVPPR